MVERQAPPVTGGGSRLVGVLALAALAWAGYEAGALYVAAAPLRVAEAPRGVVSLQLAANPAGAVAIERAWSCAGRPAGPCQDSTPLALDLLIRERRQIAAGFVGLLLLTLWAAAITRPARWFLACVVGLIAAGAAADLVENHWLAAQLRSGASLSADELAGLVTLTRLAAMSKFVLLLIGVVGAVALTGGACRLALLERRERLGGSSGADVMPPPEQARPRAGDELASFRELLTRENAGIFPDAHTRSPDQPVLVDHRAADEPRVLFRAADVIGLALSGGGIRSATFNLGLLEGLHRLNLLPLFDYVATVSGGGYVGSFWSDWLARQQAKLVATAPPPGHGQPAAPPEVPPELLFPSHRDAGSGPQNRVDRAQERHLREFSGFLAPRWGFFEVETWTAVVAIVSGLLPALGIALSVIGLLLVGWLSLTFALAYRSPLAPLPFILLLTWGALRIFERMWHEVKPASAGHTQGAAAAAQPAPVRRGISRYKAVQWAALTLVAVLQWQLPKAYGSMLLPVFDNGGWHPAPGTGVFEQWWTVAGIANPSNHWLFSPRLFDFSLVWLTVAVIMIALRVSYALWPFIAARESLAAYDRVLMRVLGLAVIWSGFALLWHLAVNTPGITRTATAALVSGSVFAALRNWIGVALNRPSQPGAMARFKPHIPQLLAYLTIVLAAVTVGRLLIVLCGVDWLRWWYAAIVMLGLLLLALFINPAAYGLHAFYRERISRAYAGACNLAEGQHAGQNRGTDPRDHDDRRLTGLVNRPLHLVCCAANDLSGDPVETLARGSRSAVLSKHGFSLGRYWAPVDTLQLGSAVTASAAAFNSNMGKISMQVGPAVAFLMTALNLRLGLWLRHPASAAARARRWPGLLLYREMLGLTSASGVVEPGGAVPALMRDVHLSDGGHFENLALYELIRRHCRYILMSDCGADPTVAFDDLGNALRRVREDFGVDISLDVEALRPGASGWSRQHVAVGTIHYSPTDQGILVYVKPTLTGDEPPDVLQYKSRNTAFPHEGTGDQFYDEAQWESYRRLGLHAAEVAFAFVPPAGESASGAGPVSRARRASARPLTGDWVFAETLHHWGATPEGLLNRVLEMTKRFGDLEAELQTRPVRGVLAEVFPEMLFVAPPGLRGPVAGGGEPAQAPLAEETDPAAIIASDLTCLLRVTQGMEDVWMACDLDRWWAHPLNLGWINLFARWATAPTFRFWWPLMGPMFSPGFREFLEQRFPAPTADDASPEAEVRVRAAQRAQVLPLQADAPDGLAATWWKQRSAQPRRWAGRTLFQNLLQLPRPGLEPLWIQVGIAAVTTSGQRAGWTSDDFFVPPSLWGAGIGWYFLDELLNTLAARYTSCSVVVKAPPVDAQHKVAMDDRRGFIEQYRKIGFREQLTGSPGNALTDDGLAVALGLEPGVDTLLVLDFDRWSRRRGR